jgi:adenosylcobinamide-phosphate synthase
MGTLLDLIIGDPHDFPHPIRAIGNLIAWLEKRLLGDVSGKSDRNPSLEKTRGTLLWSLVVIVTVALTAAVTIGAYAIHPYIGILVEAILTCYILAAKSLYKESMAVTKELDKGDLDKARYALSMIVGRDTAPLDSEEVAKAAVETVAENTSDGVIAPLIYSALGGPILGMLYKAVNTMDSMIGYKNEKYENFGRFAAKADDFFNFIPARLSAIFMMVGTFILSLFDKTYSPRAAVRIWRRDRLNHKSPNSAQTESVCAGALGLLLGGDHLYKGVMVHKPTIGDETRKTEPADIRRVNSLMFATEAVAFVIILTAICAI